MAGAGGVCGTAHLRSGLSYRGVLQMLWSFDAEQGQATGQHRPGGFGECEPGAVGGLGFLVPSGEDLGEEGEEGVGDCHEVVG
ncbi:hypothetical protein IQ63_14840 [Streptomyces acidiscabies]|uniref:Uncharacterized protein n=1 Tax=Streptomyces acidiscabies TaxID=42234 RepID=A0A0L0KCP1_9ACTN|nr:hypothetical protein IQ63_14840 [Streptomyces acidiscabies]